MMFDLKKGPQHTLNLVMGNTPCSTDMGCSSFAQKQFCLYYSWTDWRWLQQSHIFEVFREAFCLIFLYESKTTM
jgi:hypothetical protein